MGKATVSDRNRRTYFVYDKETGKIAHTVYVEVALGADMPPETEIEQQVMISAVNATGNAAQGLDILLVGPERVKPGMIYRVDPRTRDLISREGTPPQKPKREL